ncbi:MAG: hypothetical protein KAH32_05345 [Chlamydiia bacterium]|nr:hypothetical protein [Chlamydiia bacterium]
MIDITNVMKSLGKNLSNSKIVKVASAITILMVVVLIGCKIIVKTLTSLASNIPPNKIVLGDRYKEHAKNLAKNGITKGGHFSKMTGRSSKEEAKEIKKDRFYQSLGGIPVDSRNYILGNLGVIDIRHNNELVEMMESFKENTKECLRNARTLSLEFVQVPDEHIYKDRDNMSILLEKIESKPFDDVNIPEDQMNKVLEELLELNVSDNRRSISLFSHEGRDDLIEELNRIKSTDIEISERFLDLLDISMLRANSPKCNFNKLSWRKFPGKKIGDPSTPSVLVLPGRSYELSKYDIPGNIIDIAIAFNGNMDPILSALGQGLADDSVAFLRKLGECIEKANA